MLYFFVFYNYSPPMLNSRERGEKRDKRKDSTE